MNVMIDVFLIIEFLISNQDFYFQYFNILITIFERYKFFF